MGTQPSEILNLVLTKGEYELVKEKRRQFDSGAYKSEAKYVADISVLLGLTSTTVAQLVSDFLLRRPACVMFLYPEFPVGDCVITKGVIEAIKRRKSE